MLGITNISKARNVLACVAMVAFAVVCAFTLAFGGAVKAFAANLEISTGAGLYVTDTTTSNGGPDGQPSGTITTAGAYVGTGQLGLWVTDSSLDDDGNVHTSDASGHIDEQLGIWVTDTMQSYDMVRVIWDLNNGVARWSDGTNNLKTQNVELGDGDEQLVLPDGISAVPGYYLAGWAISDGTTIDAHANVGKDLAPTVEYRLVAVWEPREYTVNLNTNGGTVSDAAWTGNTATFAGPDGSVTLPTPEREGYDFSKWDGTPAGPTITSAAMEEAQKATWDVFTASLSTSYTAQWAGVDAEIVFVSKMGELVVGTAPAAISGKTGETLASTSLPAVTDVPTGYDFQGWFDNAACTGTALAALPSTFPAGTTTYYAKWSVNAFTIEFYRYSGDATPIISRVNVGAASEVELPTSTSTDMAGNGVEGHTVSRWYVFEGNETPLKGSTDTRMDLRPADDDETYTWYAAGAKPLAHDLAAVAGTADGTTIKLFAAWTPVYSMTMPVGDSQLRYVTLKNGMQAAVAGPEITMTSTTPRSVDLMATSEINDGAGGETTNVAKVLGVSANFSDLTADTNLTFAKSVLDKGDGTVDEVLHATDSQSIPLFSNGATAYVGTASPSGTLTGTLVLHLGPEVTVTLEANDTGEDWGRLTTVKWLANIDTSGNGPDTGAWLYANAGATSFADRTVHKLLPID